MNALEAFIAERDRLWREHLAKVQEPWEEYLVVSNKCGFAMAYTEFYKQIQLPLARLFAGIQEARERYIGKKGK